MLTLFIRITLSSMILYISTLSQVEACCCTNILPSQYAYCHDEAADSSHTVQVLQCQCDQQTNNTLVNISHPTVLLSATSLSLVPSTNNTLRSQLDHTIYRPPIFI